MLAVIGLLALIGAGALVLDVGSWFREQRRLQSVADAAALAGAQELPYDPGAATAVAVDYAGRNGGAELTVRFPEDYAIEVEARATSPSVLSQLLGVSGVRVSARARAEVRRLARALGAVPIVVSASHPDLFACGGPCFDSPTTIDVEADDALGGGQMGLIDLRPGGDGSVTADQIAGWVSTGLEELMDPDSYYTSAGSCKFSNRNFHDALDAKILSGEPLLFPVYDPELTDTVSRPPRYFVVGWAAFVVTGYRLNGCGRNDWISGYFVPLSGRGAAATSPYDGTPDYGVRIVSLAG